VLWLREIDKLVSPLVVLPAIVARRSRG